MSHNLEMELVDSVQSSIGINDDPEKALTAPQPASIPEVSVPAEAADSRNTSSDPPSTRSSGDLRPQASRFPSNALDCGVRLHLEDLIRKASEGVDAEKAAAVSELSAKAVMYQDVIRELRGIEVLVKLVSEANAKQRAWSAAQKAADEALRRFGRKKWSFSSLGASAAEALGGLALDNAKNQDATREAKGLEELLELASSGMDVQKKGAVEALLRHIRPLNAANQDALHQAT